LIQDQVAEILSKHGRQGLTATVQALWAALERDMRANK